MAQGSSSVRSTPTKSNTASSSTCAFLISDCDDEDESPKKSIIRTTSSTSTGETPAKRRFGYSRQEKSLGTLTRRFMSLLRQSKTGIMDLKNVADSLATKQKRRIYDITNVLEGIGLIEKQSKNTIKWKGAISGENTVEAYERLNRAQTQLQELEAESKFWDEKLALIEKNIANTMDDIAIRNLLYLTHEDLSSSIDDEIVLVVEGVAGTTMKVDEIMEGDKLSHQFHFHSQHFPVTLKLLNRFDQKNSTEKSQEELENSPVTKEPFILLTEMAEVGDYLDALGDDESFIDLLDENDQQDVPMSPCS